MSNNFITNSAENATLKKRLEKLILASQELKFLVGFFYFSGWQEIYKKLQDNPDVTLKILVGLQVDKYLSTIVEVGLQFWGSPLFGLSHITKASLEEGYSGSYCYSNVVRRWGGGESGSVFLSNSGNGRVGGS